MDADEPSLIFPALKVHGSASHQRRSSRIPTPRLTTPLGSMRCAGIPRSQTWTATSPSGTVVASPTVGRPVGMRRPNDALGSGGAKGSARRFRFEAAPQAQLMKPLPVPVPEPRGRLASLPQYATISSFDGEEEARLPLLREVPKDTVRSPIRRPGPPSIEVAMLSFSQPRRTTTQRAGSFAASSASAALGSPHTPSTGMRPRGATINASVSTPRLHGAMRTTQPACEDICATAAASRCSTKQSSASFNSLTDPRSVPGAVSPIRGSPTLTSLQHRGYRRLYLASNEPHDQEPPPPYSKLIHSRTWHPSSPLVEDESSEARGKSPLYRPRGLTDLSPTKGPSTAAHDQSVTSSDFNSRNHTHSSISELTAVESTTDPLPERTQAVERQDSTAFNLSDDSRASDKTGSVMSPQFPSWWAGRFAAINDRLHNKALQQLLVESQRSDTIDFDAGFVDPDAPDHPSNKGWFNDSKRAQKTFHKLQLLCGTDEARESLEAFQRIWQTRRLQEAMAAPGKHNADQKKRSGILDRIRKMSYAKIGVLQ